MSDRLAKQLAEVGFTRDEFIGGTTGVVHPCHYSNHPTSDDELESKWQNSLLVLSHASSDEFHGYAEAEVTPPHYRLPLPWKPFDPSVPFPFGRLEYEECPPDKHKDFDIHVTADLANIDPRLARLLEDEINFNYVDIRKPSGNVVRVYTFQPLGVKVSPNVFDLLATYFKKAGGLDGKIKLEACRAYQRFPATVAVCPIITRLPALRQ